MRFQEDRRSSTRTMNKRRVGEKGAARPVPERVLPSPPAPARRLLSWLRAVRVTDSSTASWLREAIGLLDNRRFPLGPSRGAFFYRSAAPETRGGPASPAPGARLGEAALQSPSFAVPASTHLPKFENGPSCPWGTVCILNVKPGKASPPPPCLQHLRPPTPRKATSGRALRLSLLGTLPHLSAIF